MANTMDFSVDLRYCGELPKGCGFDILSRPKAMAETRNKNPDAVGGPEGIFKLLDRTAKGRGMIVRDDQFSFSELLDAARMCCRQRQRFHLIDTGKLSLFELEWLGEAGTDIYTSDEARPKVEELDFLARACARGKAVVAFFHHGRTEEKAGEQDSLPFLEALAHRGVYLHLSNREKERSLGGLSRLASACRRGDVWLVYYHHGPFAKQIGDLIREGAWVHLSDRSLSSGEAFSSLAETIKEYSGNKPRVVVHIEEGLAAQALLDLERTGAFLLFKTPPSDYRSIVSAIEKRAKKRRLDFRAYYLHTTFLL